MDSKQGFVFKVRLDEEEWDNGGGWHFSALAIPEATIIKVEVRKSQGADFSEDVASNYAPDPLQRLLKWQGKGQHPKILRVTLVVNDSLVTLSSAQTAAREQAMYAAQTAAHEQAMSAQTAAREQAKIEFRKQIIISLSGILVSALSALGTYKATTTNAEEKQKSAIETAVVNARSDEKSKCSPTLPSPCPKCEVCSRIDQITRDNGANIVGSGNTVSHTITCPPGCIK